MKKILLTSTALVAFAGAAAAEVTISGSAEMGIFQAQTKDGSGNTTAESKTQFHTDVDVTFSMSGETDSGLAFGVSVDLDEAAGLGNEETNAGFAVFVSGDFGTITMGDTDGAMDWAMTEAGNIGNPGSIRDDETSHPGYFGSYHDGAGAYDNQVLRYNNTFGDFGVAVSFEQSNIGADNDGDGLAGGSGETLAADEQLDTAFALGFKYNAELAGLDLALGLGYQVVNLANTDGDNNSEIVGFSVTTTFDNGLSAGLQYTSGDVNTISDSTHIGIGFGYEVDALSFHFNYGQFDYGNDTEVTGFGIAVGYDLGGGASVLFGYGTGETKDAAGNTTSESESFSLGLSMSF